MNGSTAHPTPSQEAAKALKGLDAKIRGVRRAITGWFVVDGLVRVIGVLLLVCAVDFAIDYLFQMDRAQRAIMLLLIIGAVAWTVWRWLLRPLRASITDEAICHEVGQRHPKEGGRILTALEFSRTDWSGDDHVSQSLVAAAVDDGGRLIKQVPFRSILRRSRFSVNLLVLVAFGCLLAAGIIGIFSNNLLGIWANRNLLLGNMSWPADFQLLVDGADGSRIIVPRGDTWPITARVPDGYRSLPTRCRSSSARAVGGAENR